MKRRGLTLVELLVALLIFALVAAAAGAALRLAVDSREQLTAAESRLAELQSARLIIAADLQSVVGRAARDAFGDAEPPFFGGFEARTRTPVAGETLLLAFVRDGWVNPDYAAPRSSLQHVEYVVRGSALLRRARPFLDDARGQPRLERTLVGDVKDVSVEFLGREGTGGGRNPWLTGWPSGGRDGRPPRAVALTLTTPRTGPMRMAFWIGETGGPASEERPAGGGDAAVGPDAAPKPEGDDTQESGEIEKAPAPNGGAP